MRASATYQGKRRVILQFPYDPELVAALKNTIPSWARSYDPATKTWTIVSAAWVTDAVDLLQEHFPNASIGHEEEPAPPPPPPPGGRGRERSDPFPGWRTGGMSGHYATLHLLPSAPRQVVDAAYRALAKLHHSDLLPATEREVATRAMQRINEAYKALTAEGIRR